MDKSHYGRKWLLKIKCTDGTELSIGNDGFPGYESLKVDFEVNYPGYEGWYFSEFNIYNPTIETEKKIIQEGAEVYFYAGYSEGNYGQIFGGKVFQSLWTREHVTDFKLTLICMDGERLFRDNFVNFTLTEYTEQTLMNEIAGRSHRKIEVGKISELTGLTAEGVDLEPLPRGTTVFGSPSIPLREVVKSNGSQMFMLNDKLNVVRIDEAPQGDYIEVNTANGLVGTPCQVDYGVHFRTLLNPELALANPLKWVKLDMSQITIQQQKAVFGQKIVSKLPKDGYFKIGGVRHSGDTRGDEWYTDVIGYSLAGKTGLQLTVPTMLNDADGQYPY